MRSGSWSFGLSLSRIDLNDADQIFGHPIVLDNGVGLTLAWLAHLPDGSSYLYLLFLKNELHL